MIAKVIYFCMIPYFVIHFSREHQSELSQAWLAIGFETTYLFMVSGLHNKDHPLDESKRLTGCLQMT